MEKGLTERASNGDRIDGACEQWRKDCRDALPGAVSVCTPRRRDVRSSSGERIAMAGVRSTNRASGDRPASRAASSATRSTRAARRARARARSRPAPRGIRRRRRPRHCRRCHCRAPSPAAMWPRGRRRAARPPSSRAAAATAARPRRRRRRRAGRARAAAPPRTCVVRETTIRFDSIREREMMIRFEIHQVCGA